VDASSQFLFVGDQSANIYAYSINSSTGALTAVTGSPFGTSSPPTAMATIQ
jgi:hypothetical protein